MKNGNGSTEVERRIAFLEQVYLDDRKRWERTQRVIETLDTKWRRTQRLIEALDRKLDRHLSQSDLRWMRALERFRKVDERFAKFDERFAKFDERFAKFDERAARNEERLKELDERLEAALKVLHRLVERREG
ncbi:MAG: hypothetical protein HYZ53_11065 [Planctomycetes bacterium]|nr:hypothetical protein [Planctomycetota bacterium]